MAHLFRQYSQMFAAFGASGLFCVSLLPQTLRLNTYKEVLANWIDGKVQPVDKDTEEIIEKVLYRMNLTPEDEANINSFFTCFGNDPVHKGSILLRTGAIIGIPPTFYYKFKADINTSLRAGERIINWESDAGQSLADSILLSEKAKAFAIAREINYTATYHLYVDGLMRAVFASAAYSVGNFMNQRLLLKERLKIWARGGVYAVLAGVAYTFYIFTSDAYFCLRDNSVDKKTAKLGWAYAEGGVEFYNKSLQRNVAMRELMGPAGASTYTVYGNDVTNVRRSYVQLTERRDNLKKYFGEYKKREETKQTDPQF